MIKFFDSVGQYAEFLEAMILTVIFIVFLLLIKVDILKKDLEEKKDELKALEVEMDITRPSDDLNEIKALKTRIERENYRRKHLEQYKRNKGEI